MLTFIALARAACLAALVLRPQSPAITRGDSLDVELASAIDRVLAGARPAHSTASQWRIVADVYRRGGARTATPLWLDARRLAPRATALAALLASIDTLGLRPADHDADAAASAVRDLDRSPQSEAKTADLARADVVLTASFVALASDLLSGRVAPRKVEPTWHIAHPAFDLRARIALAVDSLRAGQAVNEALAAMRPDYGSYGALIQALKRYRALDQAGGWPKLPNVPVLRPLDVAPVVPVLRERLAVEGYLASAAGSDTFDLALAGAVADFQEHHGLEHDSIIGAATRAALAVPAARRVLQIEANLERLRWLPPVPAERFIVVNVPAFILYAFDGTTRALDMRVVVGDELAGRRTPIFADTMEFIQFGPYWNVPRSIAVNEILPQARRDRGYLARNRYQILRGWGDNAPVVDPNQLSNSALMSSRYRVRQLPGPNNALGRVKFMFPNDYAVYLHDTPARARFGDADRAVSHGCVRVADPVGLATFVLRDRPDWPRDRIAATLDGGKRVRLDLAHGPPVYIVYLTAYGRNGEAFFRDDIYERDNRLIRALAAASGR